MRKIAYFIVVFLLLFGSTAAFAVEPIMITYSPDRQNVIFDGKWTFYWEWKRTSLNELRYDDGTTIELRTGHQGNFIYVFVDSITQTNIDKVSDTATICFATKTDRTVIPDPNDYCFVSVLDGKSSFVLQGGAPLEFTGHFKKIPLPPGFIGVGGVSDENDRYTPIPHAGYEFRIPTDLVGRSDTYGFYLVVYDAPTNKYYTWPQNANATNIYHIASPTQWGDMISPDRSLPEFPVPALLLVPAFFFAIYLTRLRYR